MKVFTDPFLVVLFAEIVKMNCIEKIMIESNSFFGIGRFLIELPTLKVWFTYRMIVLLIKQ